MNNFTKSPTRNFVIFVAKFLLVIAFVFLTGRILDYDVTWAFAGCVGLLVALWDRLSLLFSLLFFDADIVKTRDELNGLIEKLNGYDVSDKNVVAIIKRKIKK